MRLLQLAIALDQVFNTLAGGWADETLSARAWRCRHEGPAWRLAYRAINALFWWQADHCRASHAAELLRRQLPAAYRPTPR